ncbi:hypothetical protein ACHAQJ_001405 [Trichoderma viride]
MSFILSRRDTALADIPDETLRQLTKMLYMDAADFCGHRAENWLHDQERKVKDINTATLLRPKDPIARFAVSMMSKHKLPFCAEGARLCPAHKALDPRIIRDMLLLVADECTIRTNRYRSLRAKGVLSPSLEGWMGRIDLITALWLGEEKFRRVFDSDRRDYLPECVRTKCEACMLAVIGGSAVYLTDLRASVLARRAYKTKTTGREASAPRLLRIVDLWMSFYRADCRYAVCRYSEALVDDLVAMRGLARKRRDKEVERRIRKGKAPGPSWNANVRLTKEGLPIPPQGRRKDGRGRTRAERAQVEKLEDDDAIKTTNHERARTEWDDWFSPDEDTYENRDGERECRVREYRRLISEGASSQSNTIVAEASFENLGNPPPPYTSNISNNTSSWTSRIDDDDSDVESPRTVEVPLLYRHDTSSKSLDGDEMTALDDDLACPRVASSIYSCDNEEEGDFDDDAAQRMLLNPFDQTLSMISRFTRHSAVPAPLGVVDGSKEEEEEEEKGGERSKSWDLALRKLEGRGEDEVASCFGTMGWDGPKK